MKRSRPMQPKWYAVVTQPKCEAKVRGELWQEGYHSFLPGVKRWTSHARRKVAKEYPLFPRYLFVEVDFPRQHFAGIFVTRGVERILGNDGIPAPMEQDWVGNMLFRYL